MEKITEKNEAFKISNEVIEENNYENSYEKSRQSKEREDQAAREKNIKDYGQKVEPEERFNPRGNPDAVNIQSPGANPNVETGSENNEVPAIKVPPIAPSR